MTFGCFDHIFSYFLTLLNDIIVLVINIINAYTGRIYPEVFFALDQPLILSGIAELRKERNLTQ